MTNPIEPDYDLLCEIYYGRTSLGKLTEAQLVSIAMIKDNPADLEYSTYREIILDAQELCVAYLADRLEDAAAVRASDDADNDDWGPEDDYDWLYSGDSDPYDRDIDGQGF